MPRVPLFDADGKEVGRRELPSPIFEAKLNVPLMHQVVVAAMAGQRSGTHSTKRRGEVRGGGKKPWRQKGTGRARHGSIRSPIWRGGGVAHGPKPRDHSQRTNKKMKRGALYSALTDALASGKLAVVKDLAFDEPKTKAGQAVIDALELDGRVLLVLAGPDEVVEKSFRNLSYVRIGYARSLGIYEILVADRVLFTAAALEVLEGNEPPAAAEPEAGEAGSKEEVAG